jgi:type IV pilus assembly protein PilX
MRALSSAALYQPLRLSQCAPTSQAPVRRLLPLARQRGIALLMVMMVTLIIVALSVSLATGVFSEHKLSRSTADQAIARQGAEAALRDAEHDLNCDRWNAATNAFEFWSTADGNSRPYCVQRVEACRQLGNAGITSTCTQGLRAMPLVDSSANLPVATSFIACSVPLGEITQQPVAALDGQVVQPSVPRYSIELFDYRPTGAKGSTPIYRIRARGYGLSTSGDISSTTVDLEAIYRPCN